MANLYNSIFGPLTKESCYYFLFLTGFFFFVLVLSILSEILFIYTNFNKLNFRMLSTGFLFLFNIFIVYFVNRLLYTICSKSLA